MKRQQDFENFYVYEGNKVAFLAAKKIIEFPGELFNPLYIYADTGLGKTHILMALYEELKKKNAAKFFTAKEFEDALDKTRVFDSAIIIDDLHMLSDNYHDLLLGVIDKALTDNRQLCFSGNAPPRDIKSIDSRLLSRIEGGLVCDIMPPKEMALVDMIKKKSGEAGVLLPDAVALELAQISTGSIRKIEGMINRIVAYSSLGSLSLDTDSIRMILKEFYPKGIYSPVSSLLEELKKNANEVLADVSEKLDEKEEYQEKIYIWEMKGFDTSALKPLLEGDLKEFKKAYDEFITKVEKLIALQKEFGSLDTSDFPDEAMKIESMLFSPAHVNDIKELTAKIKQGMSTAIAKEAFKDYLLGDSNRDAYNLYKEQVFNNLGEKFNPFVIYGSDKTGRTRFLTEIKVDLEAAEKKILFVDLLQEGFLGKFKKPNSYDILIIDNFHQIFSMDKEIRGTIVDFIRASIDSNKAVIFSSANFPPEVSLSEAEKSIFELGIETGLNAPDADIAESYIRTKVDRERAEELISPGLPEFKDYSAIDNYIESFKKETAEPEPVAASVEKTGTEQEMPGEELVNLGLEGETAIPEEVKEDSAPSEIVSLGLPGEEGLTTEEKLVEQEESVPETEPVEQSVDDGSSEPVSEAGIDETKADDSGIVSLGLPGEEEAQKPETVSGTKSKDAEKKTEPVSVHGEPLKAIKEDRFIIKEIPGELIEDNF